MASLEKKIGTVSEKRNFIRVLRDELKKAVPDVARIKALCLQLGLIPDSMRAQIWKLLLGVEKSMSDKFDGYIQNTKQDMENQRVIRADAERTRASIPEFRTPEMQQFVERVLTFYCKTRKVKYKQGMNEVLAPFILLHLGGRSQARPRSTTPTSPTALAAGASAAPGSPVSPRRAGGGSSSVLSEGEVFCCYYAFLNKMMPNLFSDEDFISLQSAFRLFRLLLLYHDPELCCRLDQYSLPPELYATPWFLTLFARNLEKRLLFQLWDAFLLEQDPALPMFAALALVTDPQHRGRILGCDPAELPQVVNHLSFSSALPGGVPGLLARARAARLRTPLSFTREVYLSCYAPSAHQNDGRLQWLEALPAFPLQPSELIADVSYGMVGAANGNGCSGSGNSSGSGGGSSGGGEASPSGGGDKGTEKDGTASNSAAAASTTTAAATSDGGCGSDSGGSGSGSGGGDNGGGDNGGGGVSAGNARQLRVDTASVGGTVSATPIAAAAADTAPAGDEEQEAGAGAAQPAGPGGKDGTGVGQAAPPPLPPRRARRASTGGGGSSGSGSGSSSSGGGGRWRSRSSVKYFTLDCRDESEFAAGHMALGFHISPLLLHDPEQLSAVLEGLTAMKSYHFCVVGGADTLVPLSTHDSDGCQRTPTSTAAASAAAAAAKSNSGGFWGWGSADAGGSDSDGGSGSGSGSGRLARLANLVRTSQENSGVTAPGSAGSGNGGVAVAHQGVSTVVAHLLQHGFQYVSICCGGFPSLHKSLNGQFEPTLVNHDPRLCEQCLRGAPLPAPPVQDALPQQPPPAPHTPPPPSALPQGGRQSGGGRGFRSRPSILSAVASVKAAVAVAASAASAAVATDSEDTADDSSSGGGGGGGGGGGDSDSGYSSSGGGGSGGGATAGTTTPVTPSAGMSRLERVKLAMQQRAAVRLQGQPGAVLPPLPSLSASSPSAAAAAGGNGAAHSSSSSRSGADGPAAAPAPTAAAGAAGGASAASPPLAAPRAAKLQTQGSSGWLGAGFAGIARWLDSGDGESATAAAAGGGKGGNTPQQQPPQESTNPSVAGKAATTAAAGSGDSRSGGAAAAATSPAPGTAIFASDASLLCLSAWQNTASARWFKAKRVTRSAATGAVSLPCLLFVMPSQIVCAELLPDQPGTVRAVQRRQLKALSKITSRKAVKDLVVFHFKKQRPRDTAASSGGGGGSAGSIAASNAAAAPSFSPPAARAPPRSPSERVPLERDVYIVHQSSDCILLAKRNYQALL